MANIEKIIELGALAARYELEDREILDKYTDKELSCIYNGIGPESFPNWLRTIINGLNPSLEVVALIHDVEWHETDHTEKTWKETNARFKRNGYKVAKAKYGWWNPFRYRVMRQSYLFSKACGTMCGRLAWDAGDRNEHIDELIVEANQL